MAVGKGAYLEPAPVVEERVEEPALVPQVLGRVPFSLVVRHLIVDAAASSTACTGGERVSDGTSCGARRI